MAARPGRRGRSPGWRRISQTRGKSRPFARRTGCFVWAKSCLRTDAGRSPITRISTWIVTFPQLVSQSDLLDDPEDPPAAWFWHLQATAGGCQWMLDQWAELRLILEEGLNWQSADKLKAIRLLGRQPIEAVDERTVLMIFLGASGSRAGPPMSFRRFGRS